MIKTLICTHKGCKKPQIADCEFCEKHAPKPKPPAEEKKDIQAIEKVIGSRDIAPQDAFDKLTRAQIDLIKRTIAKGASDDELRLFVQVCRGSNLNPFLRQVHLVPFWDSKEGIERRVIIVGIDGFRAVAEESGAYAGNDDPIFEGEEKLGTLTHPAKATVSVYKIVDGQRYTFTASARWSEYYPGEKKGYQWQRMPYLMLGKCAEALALRKAFPKLLSGMYAQEEMDRVLDEGKDAQKQKKVFETLLETIKKASLKELEEYKAKMEKSDKYTDEQKAEFSKLVEPRIAELKKQPPQKTE